ncbi:zinc ABC transporter substrate-binding protein [Candidatus Saccharibacteria bacterium]|nr:zinc ABC transporter substrate-binding protein [Candidatus Saccharibacteria bacterium]
MKNLKKLWAVFGLILMVGLLAFLVLNREKFEQKKYSVVSTSFPGYDFARAVTKNTNISAKMLGKPGAETHTYEPTPQDIIDIKNADMFIYVGGDSDTWVEKILKDVDTKKTHVVKLVDLVSTVNEEIVEGREDEDEHEHDHDHSHSHDYDHDHDDHNHKHDHDEEEEGPEIDEHVWTSPKKAMEIVKKIAKVASEIDAAEKTKIDDNAEKYVAEIAEVDKDLHQAIDGKISEIVVADRFPFRYFADEFSLKYAAAFSGCSEQTEASAKTISFLINKVKQEKIKKIYMIELSNGKIAETVSKDTGAEVLELHSAHNVTADDFSKGVTYVDLMKRNLLALSK